MASPLDITHLLSPLRDIGGLDITQLLSPLRDIGGRAEQGVPDIPGQTPPFFPEIGLGTNTGFPSGLPPINVSRKQAQALTTAKDPSLANLLLSKLGKPGRKLMPVADFLGQVQGKFEGAARRGTLGALAPKFQSGVQAADQNALNKQLVEAQIQQLLGPKPADIPNATTERGKTEQDFRNNIITKEQRDAKMAEIDAEERRRMNEDAARLRSERDTVIKGTSESLQSLRAAETLLEADNPFADVASLTSFIRSIDNSVVRPSEQDNFNAALGLLNQIESIWQRAKGEGVLTPEARKALKESIAALRENYEAILDGQEQFYRDEAKAAGVDEARVLRGVKPPRVTAKPVSDVPPENNKRTPETINKEIADIDAQIAEIDAQLEQLNAKP